MHILVQMAMLSEFEPIQSSLTPSRVPLDKGFPGHLYSQTEHAGHKLTFALPGLDAQTKADRVGPINAALLCFEGITHFHPDLVLNIGTCGGFKARGGAIGDVYISEAPVFYHDRRVPLEGFDAGGFGYYKPSRLSTKEPLPFKSGKITTGSSLHASQQDMEIILEHQADCKEMELAAIGYVASRLKTPWVGLKSITDILDRDAPATETEFLANLEVASKHLHHAFFYLMMQ